MKLIKKVRQGKNAKGETHNYISFYLVIEGVDRPIQIDPHSFGSKGSTFAQLNWLAKYEK